MRLREARDMVEAESDLVTLRDRSATEAPTEQPIEIECMLSIRVNGEEQVYAHTYKLEPADLGVHAPDRFSEIQVAVIADEPALLIHARAKFRRLR
jgi:hypothetical protein